MYNCPHCGSNSFSFWQKQLLGPARSIECRNCKERVTVPWGRALLAILPIIVLATIGVAIYNSAPGNLADLIIYTTVGILVGFVISAPLYHRYVPLIPRKP